MLEGLPTEGADFILESPIAREKCGGQRGTEKKKQHTATKPNNNPLSHLCPL